MRILAMTALVHFVAMTKKHEIATILLSQNLAMTVLFVILKALAEVSLKTAFVVLSFFDKKAKCLKTKYDKVIDLP